jgi:hypothetical protein
MPIAATSVHRLGVLLTRATRARQAPRVCVGLAQGGIVRFYFDALVQRQPQMTGRKESLVESVG